MRRFTLASVIAILVVAQGGGRPAASLGNIGTSGHITFNTGTKETGTSVQIVNADGSGARQFLPAGSQQVVWAPDAKRVAFTRIEGGNVDVYVMNADGSGLRRLTTGPADDASPSWSPDGTRLVFDTDRNGTGDVYAINANGTGETLLTPPGSNEWFPSWSPAGDRIAFVSDRSGDDDIWVMNADGSGAYNASHTAGLDYTPDFSPDGKRIVFEGGDGETNVFVMNADGSGRTQLTTGADYSGTADWSPDGTKIVYHAGDPNRDIFIMNANGSAQARLAGSATSSDRFPDWQPPLCTVAAVVDGDTFDCTDGTRVNMLQIDTPELAACGGDWAKSALQYIFLPPGRQVALAFDTTTVDASGSVLAAPIWLGDDGTDYNLSIVMAYVGLAKASGIGAGNVKYQGWATSSQNWAQAAQWNMWAPGKPYNGGC